MHHHHAAPHYQGDKLQIDHILLSKGLMISSAWIDHSQDIASSFDHFPVVVDIELAGEAPTGNAGPSNGFDSAAPRLHAIPWQSCDGMHSIVTAAFLTVGYFAIMQLLY